MIVVTVARKPLTEPTVAASAVAHGTGPINVDATRIATSGSEPDSGAMYYKNRGLAMPGNRTNYFGGEDGVVKSEPMSGKDGRWPANLILEHLPGCVQDVLVWVCKSGCPVAALDQVDVGGSSRFFKQVQVGSH